MPEIKTKWGKIKISWFWIVIVIGLFWDHIENLYNHIRDYYDTGRSVEVNYLDEFQPKEKVEN